MSAAKEFTHLRFLHDPNELPKKRMGDVDIQDVIKKPRLNADNDDDCGCDYATRFAKTVSIKSKLYDIGEVHRYGIGVNSCQLPLGEYDLIAVLLVKSVRRVSKTNPNSDAKYAFFVRDNEKTVRLINAGVYVSGAFHMWTPDLHPLLNQMASPKMSDVAYDCYLARCLRQYADICPIGTVVNHELRMNRHGRRDAILTIDVDNPSGNGRLRVLDAGIRTREFEPNVVLEKMNAMIRDQIQKGVKSNRAPMTRPTDNRAPLPSVKIPSKITQSQFVSPCALFSPLMDKRQAVAFEVLQLSLNEQKVRAKSGCPAKVKLIYPILDGGFGRSKTTPKIATCLFNARDESNASSNASEFYNHLAATSASNCTFVVTQATKNTFVALPVRKEALWWRRIEMAQPHMEQSAYACLPSLAKGMANAPGNGSLIVVAFKKIRRKGTNPPLIIQDCKGDVYKFSSPDRIGINFETVPLPCRFNLAAWRLESPEKHTSTADA